MICPACKTKVHPADTQCHICGRPFGLVGHVITPRELPEKPRGNYQHLPPDQRELVIGCSRELFGLWTWAARQADPPAGIEDFARTAIDERVRAVARELVSHGKKLPQWVAEALDRK